MSPISHICLVITSRLQKSSQPLDGYTELEFSISLLPAAMVVADGIFAAFYSMLNSPLKRLCLNRCHLNWNFIWRVWVLSCWPHICKLPFALPLYQEQNCIYGPKPFFLTFLFYSTGEVWALEQIWGRDGLELLNFLTKFFTFIQVLLLKLLANLL